MGDEYQNEDLPDKPPVEGLPSDAELEAAEEPGDLDVSDEEFLDPQTAAADDTVDDGESDEESS